MIEKNVPTTSNTEPQQASYPVPRKPALGPIITTGNTEVPKKEKKPEPVKNTSEIPAIPKKRRGRPKGD